jgi:hypothetical protein
MENSLKLYKLRAIKIGWINEQMYHLLLKKESHLNIFIQLIKVAVFIINIMASAVGEDINYRWWTITTSIIIAFDVYINKIKDEATYGSKIELHRSMTDECIRFTEILDNGKSLDIIESAYNSLIEKSSKLHIDATIFDSWEEEFKKRGIKELNAFDQTDQITKELQSEHVENKLEQYSPRLNNPTCTVVTGRSENKKADFELQQLFNNLNIKVDE